MSHFTVMVIGEDYDKLLKPFDECLELPRYVEFTKAQLIENEKKEIKDYEKGFYADYLKDPKKYAEDCNDQHLKYISEEFPKKLNWSDDQIYQHAIRWYDKENIGSDGEVYSTSNPNGKWDWYVLGGRWSGMIKLKEGSKGIKGKSGVFRNEVGIDSAKKGDIANWDELFTFAFLKDGKWLERGKMGWFGSVGQEKSDDEWKKEVDLFKASVGDNEIVNIVDCHV